MLLVLFLTLRNVHTYYFSAVITSPPGGRGAKCCDEYVCLSVCSQNSKTTWPNFTKICACCLWFLDSALFLTALRYVVYFRFCGWHRVFITALWRMMRITNRQQNTTSITARQANKIFLNDKIRKYWLWVALQRDEVCYRRLLCFYLCPCGHKI